MTPDLGSMLLASTEPDRLRDWYSKAFEVVPEVHGGILQMGGVGLIIDERDDISPTNPEPGRVILNFHVPDARAAVEHLDGLGVTWVAELEEKNLPGMFFATCLDPDGNFVQVIQLPPGYGQEG